MGIDVHAFNFLRYARKFGDFGATLTIGRQNINLRPDLIRHYLNTDNDYAMGAFCEPLLEAHFGASRTESIDNSPFENATIVFDMNNAIPTPHASQYDTIFDGGCTEHIFNAPQALKNISLMCRPNGQILHVLPANNFCGHGFWQFSPELFFSLYSLANGYEQTEVFLADLWQWDRWFRVKQPTEGKRINVRSATPLYLLVRTVRARGSFSHDNTQQSDYIYRWSRSDDKGDMRNNSASKPLFGKIHGVLRRLFPRSRRLSAGRRRPKASERLDARNPGLAVVPIKSIL